MSAVADSHTDEERPNAGAVFDIEEIMPKGRARVAACYEHCAPVTG